MAMTPLTDAQLDQTLEALRVANGVHAHAARALGIPRGTFDNRIRQAKARGQLRELPDSLRDGVFELAKAKIDAPRWTLPKAKRSSSEVVPILFGSDYQWGETIRPEDLDGVNGFDLEVAHERLRMLFERTIAICRDALSSRYRFPGLVYLRGGDLVSGDIHRELRETNALSAIPATIDLVKHEVAGVELLLEFFPRVHVITVGGNHGRTTEKPQHKRWAEENYDTLSGYMLESYFAAKGERRVSFDTPASGDALFKVAGWQFLLTHGDRIGSSGGQGFIGPAATIARGMKRTFDYYGTLGKRLDYMLVGHFHTSLRLEHGYSNGCLPGVSEYARSFRMRPTRPSQWLLLVNQAHGVFSPWEIFLDNPLRLGDAQEMPWSSK